MAKEDNKKARFINPPNKLKQKVGTGGIDPKLLLKSQEYINNNDLNFLPVAKEYLKKLADEVKAAKSGHIKHGEAISNMVGPVMQLKANGGMFRYQLVSDVADIALQFLERIEELNEESIEVIEAHSSTIKVILTNDLRGDGGQEGYALVKELDQACRRYFDKYDIDIKAKKDEKPAKKSAKKTKK